MAHIDLTADAIGWFDKLPCPIWVFEQDSLQILAANDAACRLVGHDRDSLLSLTIADLRPDEDRDAIRGKVAGFDGPSLDAGQWRIDTASGQRIHARFHWQKADYQGRKAVLASVLDESPVVALETEAQDMKAQRNLAREEFQALFECSPRKALALRPGTHEILAVSDMYLKATMTQREAILGRSIFDVFPDDPDEPDAQGVENLRASLRRVETLKQPDSMPLQRYPVPRPDGSFEERFWTVFNLPVVLSDDTLAYIIHRVDDVTDLVQQDAMTDIGDIGDETAPGVSQWFMRAVAAQQQLQEVLTRSREHEARLRTASRLLKVGAWEYDLKTQQTSWSDEVFEIYGCPDREKAPDQEDYLALVHPDDREMMLANYQEFFESDERQFEFQHRIVGDDGAVRHVRGVAELHDNFGHEIAVGFVQDITQQVETQRDLSYAQDLIRLAGQKARVGGWRVDLEKMEIFWSDETALIHEVPPGFSPELEEAINYYVEEDRERVSQIFFKTAEEGVPSDFVARIRTARGNVVSVRALGEAVRDSGGKIVAVQGAFQDITDLVEARTHAERLQQELLRTIENMQDAFIKLDTEWRVTYANPLAIEIAKLPREGLEGTNFWDLFPDAIGSRFEREYRKAMGNHTVVRFREYYEPNDLWAEVDAHPVPDGLAIYFRDVRESMQKEQRLQLLETAIERTNDILMITEAWPLDAPDGPKIIYVNDAFERITGYAPHEVIGKTPRMLQGPGTDREEVARIGGCLRDLEPVRAELQNYTKSGEAFWIEMDIVPIVDEAGEHTHWVSIERDVTEQRKAEEATARSQEMFRIVSEITNDFVWEYDVSNDAWHRTARHLKMLGFKPDQTPLSLEQTIQVVHPDDREAFKNTFLEAIHGDTNAWKLNYRVIDRDGATRYVENLAAIIRDDQGKAVRVVGGLTDVTEVRELDRQLRESQKMEAVGQLTGGLAHDFNNLLTIILGSAEELSIRVAADERARSLAEVTMSAAERGAELTSRLLSFARRQTLEPRIVDLNEHLQNLDAMLRRVLPETISIEFWPGEDLWKTELDAGQLDNAILNLAINARDAMPDGGNLTIETANAVIDPLDGHPFQDDEAGQYVMISVSDDGIGMDRETRERAFEPFFTTKAVGEGSGLGLSMVFGFTKQSRGNVHVYSEPGEGTTVKLYFPRVTQPGEPETMIEKDETETTGSEHILIVEDDDLVRQYLQDQLESLGYRVTAAENGKAALKILESDGGSFDMLLTDIVMPGGINGQELADMASKMQPDLKVLFTSGYTDRAVLQNGRLNPGSHLLGKPYRRKVLAQKVREVLDE